VRLTATDSHWQLTIEADGAPFRGDAMVIRERARLIEGEVAVSNPNGGSRLVVTVPLRQRQGEEHDDA
jgi:signal transduction histidine kinase